MHALTLLFDATLRYQHRVKQAPNTLSQDLLQQALKEQTELDDDDYAYLLIFLESLRSAKKAETNVSADGLRLGLLAHAISEFSTPTEENNMAERFGTITRLS